MNKENYPFTKIYHQLLGKNIGGVEFDIECVCLWVSLYDRRGFFKNDRETLESISKVLHLKKDKASSLLRKLLASGVVQAELVVKNAGVKKGNEGKAPKRWKFVEIDNPEDHIKGKHKKVPKPPTTIPRSPSPKAYIPELDAEDPDDDCPF